MTALEIFLSQVEHTAHLCPDEETASKLYAHLLQFRETLSNNAQYTVD